MKLSGFLFLKAVVTLIFGMAFLLITGGIMAIFGVALDEAGLFMARFVGVGMIGLALICFSEKNKPPRDLKGILFSLFITDTIGFIVALQLQLSGLMNFLGWLVVLIWLSLALGLGYFRFYKPIGY